MQTSIVPVVNNTTSSRAWMSWSGIVVSSFGALLILAALAGLPVFDDYWSAGLVVVSPLFGLVRLLDVVGIGLAPGNWHTLAIEFLAGGALCLLGASLLAARHVRELASATWW